MVLLSTAPEADFVWQRTFWDESGRAPENVTGTLLRLCLSLLSKLL
jgi:hypothetical protein